MEARSHLVPFPDPLSRGRNALSRGNWEEARVFFERALDGDEVPEALEGISWAAWWTGDAQALFPCRERAYHAYRKKGDRRNAARMALWMASDHLDFRGEAAVASGWRQRARRLLEGLGSTPEEGWLHVFEGAHALEEKADAATAAAKGARAVILGRETGVLDLEMMGLALEGFALVTMGRVDDGMRRLDQAVAAAVGGEFQDHAFVCWASCYLIFACEHVRDFDRAAQWCERMKEFSTRLNIQFFMGVCRAHYGGVLLWRGK